MSFSVPRALTVARREYLSTVRRKAFVFTIVGLPMLYAFLFFIMIKPQMSERVGVLRNFKVLGVVDSSGLFADAPRETRTDIRMDNPFAQNEAPKTETVTTEVRFYRDLATAQTAVRSGEANQVLVVPADYRETGKLRRYARSPNLFSSTDERVLNRWLVRGMLVGKADSLTADRAVRPLSMSDLYVINRQGSFELHDERKEMLDFILPFVFGLLLGLCIVIGGQYLLQGVNEEKESRILESLLCTVSPDELLAGKLIGLGGAGLTLVGAWLALGSAVGGPAVAMAQVHVQPAYLAILVAYFLLGYLFVGSMMISIGSMASTMREAQQFSVFFTFANFIPFYLLQPIIGHPDSSLAVTVSMIPFTAPVSMALRMSAPGAAVPPWQIALSLTILAASGLTTLFLASRIFRVGMLMYGKTPNLPEILRWVRTR